MAGIDPIQSPQFQQPVAVNQQIEKPVVVTDSFQAGSASGEMDINKLRETIRDIPKVDLHRHLEGAIKPETIIKVAQKYGIELPSYDPEKLKPYVQVTDQDKTLIDFLKKFDIIGKLFVNKKAIREITEQCIADAKGENVKAMELRFSPMYMAASANMDMKDVVDAVIDGAKRGEKKYGVKTGLIMIIERQMGPDKGQSIEELAKQYGDSSLAPIKTETVGEKAALPGLRKGILGIDLANDEFHFPPGPYSAVFRAAEKDYLHRTVHAGEALGSDSVKVALENCGAERIGHGVRAMEDPELVKKLQQQGVTLEMCPTSNIQTQAVQDFKSHPLKKFYDQGLKVTINTDDPAVCDTDMNKEFERAILNMGCTLDDVKRMNLYAVDALFFPGPLKAALKSEIEETMFAKPDDKAGEAQSGVKTKRAGRKGRKNLSKTAASKANKATALKETGPAPLEGTTAKDIQFQTVPGLSHIAVGSLDALKPLSEKEIQDVNQQMVRYMHDWPSVTSVITVEKGRENESPLLVESRPNAIGRGALEGIYEAVTKFSASPSIKEAAMLFPSKFTVVKQLNDEGTLHEMRLPGAQTVESVSKALQEGTVPNQLEMVRQLVDNLPKGCRVALLLDGPSGAGKSSLIKEIKKYASEIGRNAADLQGDMYFKDIDDADYPLTPKGAPYWDSLKVMDMNKFIGDISELIEKGAADTPIYNFRDVRPGGWRKPVKFCGYREEKPRHMEIGKDDILIIDSLHAGNEQLVSHLAKSGLAHVTVYLDSQIPEDRLVRRIVRDYAERGGIPAEKNMEIWDQTTWPGEVDFVRKSILHMDPAQDVFVITKFANDMGIDMEEIKSRVTGLDEYGLPPTYETLSAPPENLEAMAQTLEQRLVEISKSGTEADRAIATRQLEKLRSAPKYSPPAA